MAQLETIVPTTELEAINTMLRAIGESPITDLDDSYESDAQVEVAVSTLRTVMREVQLYGWRFNTRLEYRIANTSNGFTVPTNLLRFEVTQRADQCGSIPQKQEDGTFVAYPTLLDITIGQEVSGSLRFVDRLTNSATISSSDRAQIFIDAVFAVDFEEMPESARNFCVKLAAMRFAQIMETDIQVSGFSEADAARAYRNLRKDQKPDRPRKFVGAYRAWNFGGRRNIRAL